MKLLQARVVRVLDKNRTVAEDLKRAHQILRQIADCFHYPPSAQKGDVTKPINRQQVAAAIQELLQETHPKGRVQRAQLRLLSAFQRRWELFGQELLPCYDIPGLPQDNLQLESLFGRLRRHQRRISGRQSTRELSDFGQAQVLFTARTFPELLSQLQLVPQETFQVQRQQLAEAELPRQFFRRLHHDPLATVSALIHTYPVRSRDQMKNEAPVLLEEQVPHTE